MPHIGITGHSNLTPDTVPIIAKALHNVLTAKADGHLVGVTCLARGADQVFARVVLDLGGDIEVILPAADYRERKVAPDNAAEFDDLLAHAATVRTLPFESSNRDAYLAASDTVLTTVEEILAVWDGQPSNGHGGTGDVIAAARKRDLPVRIIWPEGAARCP